MTCLAHDPDGGFALLSNRDDVVHFTSSTGALIETVPMPEPSEYLPVRLEP